MTEDELDRLNQVQREIKRISDFLRYVSLKPRGKKTWLHRANRHIKEMFWAYGAISARLDLEPEDEEAICDFFKQKLERLKIEFAEAGGSPNP